LRAGHPGHPSYRRGRRERREKRKKRKKKKRSVHHREHRGHRERIGIQTETTPARLGSPIRPLTLFFSVVSVLSVVRSFSVSVFVVVFSLCVLCGLRGERGFALGPPAGPQRRAAFA
jgi:hypothetical protein